MPAVEEVFYRLRTVLGFLEEARQASTWGVGAHGSIKPSGSRNDQSSPLAERQPSL